MFNNQLDITSPKHLRNDPIVKAWIADFQKNKCNQHLDCRLCGWPHSSYTLCGMGSTFGVVTLGGYRFSVDTSNVAWLRGFIDELASCGFHQRNQRYFKRDGDIIVISYIEYYNNCPQLKQWKIPVTEFASIVCAVSHSGETGERWQEILTFLSSDRLASPSPARQEPK